MKKPNPILLYYRGGSRGGGPGGPGPPLSESLGIDFYSGFRGKKTQGGVQFEILKKSRYRLL